ncbi:MAG: aminomethyl-transferring glycine dehydrogenase subunit GcvPA [Chitinispirillia bacterium]|jgi:glycine dehydrogenase subunit 1
MNYIANTFKQQQEMLKTCEVSSIDELFKQIPENLKPLSFSLPEGLSELEVTDVIRKMASLNYSNLINFLGGGFYDHFIPAAIEGIISRGEFYTAYTPYQPELSQGTLQAIYEYQTDICRLTDLDYANASLYDGGTALYEACQMAINTTNRNHIIMDGGVNPIYKKMIYSYTSNLSIDFTEIPVLNGHTDREKLFHSLNSEIAAVILQNPDFFGVIDDYEDICTECHNHGILVIQSTYPVALALIKTPGECGVDIATGEGQSLGIPLSFGGPYLGFMAITKSLIRKMPGRISGRTTDTLGREGFVLTMQTREQHIRREKATSNICTNQALCALRAHVFLSLLGNEGLREMAQLCLDKAYYAKKRIQAIPSVEIMNSYTTFNEFTVKLPIEAGEVASMMIDRGFAAGFPLGRYYPDMKNHLLVAVTEKRTKNEIGMFAETLEDVL